jgi:hypothetical protein
MIERRRLFLTLGNSSKIKKKNKENKPIYHLREELHQKLHFKALENLTMFKTSTMNHNLFKVWSKEDIKAQKNISVNKNIYYAGLSNGFNKTQTKMQSINSYIDKSKSTNNIISNIIYDNKNNVNDKINEVIYSYTNRDNLSKKYNENQKNDNIFTNKKILEDLELTKEIITSNPLLFNYNFNGGRNYYNNKKTISFNKLNNLKQIAFNINSDDSENYEILKNENQFEDLKREENVIIDGKQFKKSETYKIADKILKKCNWNKKKS